MFDYRNIRRKSKTVPVKFKQGRWHCIITTEAQEKDILDMLSPNGTRQDAAIDTGMTALLTDSQFIQCPFNTRDKIKKTNTADNPPNKSNGRMSEDVNPICEGSFKSTACAMCA